MTSSFEAGAIRLYFLKGDCRHCISLWYFTTVLSAFQSWERSHTTAPVWSYSVSRIWLGYIVGAVDTCA
ncbi:hypothetical protein [Nostoc commune]|uniref:hypothetical protein n=1 Tax=Nostoc commune TaxID=1178 RepID=UPI0018C5EA55|nr:hypothetical protein [Nostoc commune]MBG1263768.1 hypothetical protein [Nostoc commune BAE]